MKTDITQPDRLKIKVCGMRDPLNIEQVAALKPDFMGFIFYQKSPRYVGEAAIEAICRLPLSIKRVGVFVNSPKDEIVKIVATYGLDYVQLHGNESPEMCAELRVEFARRATETDNVAKQVGIIKAVSISTAEDLRTATLRYDGHTDYLLFDTRTPHYGGSGESFDWRLLEHYMGSTPFFLSGGISPLHTAQIKQLAHTRTDNMAQLFALDLNSRFETEPGIKNVEQLKTFIYEQN